MKGESPYYNRGEDRMNNEYRVYTIRLARYLTDKGFNINRTTQDVKRPDYFNWYFDNTPELVKAIEEY